MRIIVVLFVLLVSVVARSEPVATTRDVPSNLRVYDSSGNAYVNLVAHGCSTGGYIIPSNHPRFETIVSILLAAQLAKSDVQIRYDGCNNNNQGIVVGVFLK